MGNFRLNYPKRATCSESPFAGQYGRNDDGKDEDELLGADMCSSLKPARLGSVLFSFVTTVSWPLVRKTSF